MLGRILSSLFFITFFSSFSIYAIPFQLPSEAQIEQQLKAFADVYICPNNAISFKQSLEKKLPCPAGQYLLPMAHDNLKNGTWTNHDLQSITTGNFDLFQPKLEKLVNIGSKTAKVVVIEYTDPQCPYCISFLQKQFPTIKKDFIDTNKVQYKIHHTPLPFHQDAFLASEANLCANEQNKYMPYHYLLMADMNKQKRTDLLAYAKQLNLDESRFVSCLDTHKYKKRITTEQSILDMVMPISFPFFIIGHYAEDKFIATSVYGEAYFHTLDLHHFSQVINDELKISN